MLLPDPKSSVRWETQRPARCSWPRSRRPRRLVRDHQRQRRSAEAEDAGRPVPRERREGRHPRLARPGLLDRDRGGGEGRGREGDRVRPPGDGGSPSIYISFDGTAVGVLQGKGVVAGLKAKGSTGRSRSSPSCTAAKTDNNSFLFKGGYESVLNPLYKNGTFKKGPQQFTPGWDNQKAGTIFEQMLVKTKQQHPGRRGGQRRPRERRRRRAEGAQAEADRAERPGCDRRRVSRTSSRAGRR